MLITNVLICLFNYLYALLAMQVVFIWYFTISLLALQFVAISIVDILHLYVPSKQGVANCKAAPKHFASPCCNSLK